MLCCAIAAGIASRRLTKPLDRSGVLVCMAIVGPGFVVGIALLYRLNEGYVPAELDRAFYPSLALMVAATVVLLRSLRLSTGQPIAWSDPDWFGFRKRRWARERRNITEQSRQHAKRLDADPDTRKYAALIRKGEQWWDEEIAYDRDPSVLATCEHLQPIERAMREAGMPLRLRKWGYVEAGCQIDLDQLQRRFPLPLEVHYANIPGDRQYDPVGAALYCQQHPISIQLIHPDEARPGTPWFPPSA